MSKTLKDFEGDWRVRWVTGVLLVIEEGYNLHIGPPINDHQVDYVLSDSSGEPIRTSGEFGPLELVDGSLHWDGPAVADPNLPTRIYISLAEGETLDGTSFRSLYGTTLRGDPEQVAIWGANDVPPPSPVAP